MTIYFNPDQFNRKDNRVLECLQLALDLGANIHFDCINRFGTWITFRVLDNKVWVNNMAFDIPFYAFKTAETL